MQTIRRSIVATSANAGCDNGLVPFMQSGESIDIRQFNEMSGRIQR